MKYFLLLFIALFSVTAMAQTTARFTVSGTITDSSNGETMISVPVTVKELPTAGAVCNAYGYYSLTLPEGKYTLLVRYLGYKTVEQVVELKQNTVINFKLAVNSQALKTVEITSEAQDQNVRTPGSPVTLKPRDIEAIPVFIEKDIMRTFTLMTPGYKSGGDGNAGYFVRGGAADQNLILLDEAPVYNASHLLGFFSTFNSDAIKDVTLYKGGMPAEYGGRLSSVMDIKMLEGNNQTFHTSGGLGLIAARLNVEGPIVKDKGSFFVSGRRTYADAFLKLTDDFKDNSLYFYDLNMKANYRINDKNKIFASGYFGRDKLGFGDNFGIDWGNATGTLRWNSIISPKFFSNTSLIYSNYDYNIFVSTGTADVNINSKIRDFNIKQDFMFQPNTRNTMKFGLNSIYHIITPGQVESTDGSLRFPTLQDRYSWENAAYFTNDWLATEKLTITYGLRLTSFSSIGEGDFYSYDDNGEAIDTVSYKAGEFVKTYFNLEPRLAMVYMINERKSIKFGYNRNTQNLHLISNSTSSTPTDLWIPSSNNVKPEIADQVSVGWFQNFKKNMYEFSAETYYKHMQNQIDYRNGANTFANDKIEGELLFGQGRAYGLELFFRKKTGQFTWSVSYTLSRTEKQIDGINDNNWYAARQDRTHDIALVGMYKINEKLTFSSSWVYSTGNAVTFPSGKYELDGHTQWLYTERNGYRMPAYHRLDIGLTWYNHKSEKFESNWNFGLYNAYGRENPWIISFRESETEPGKTEAVQTSLFRWVPTVTYNFKF
jgi:CarboxypepD_reg-like domain/TonB-dependent Receptor Plug Domain